MKRTRVLWVVASALAGGLMFCPVIQARTATDGQPSHRYTCAHRRGKKRPPLKAPYEAVGSVNAAAGTLTVVPMNGASHTAKAFRTTPDTVVMINGQPATLGELRPGMKIEVGQGMDADVAEQLNASPAPAQPKGSGGGKRSGSRNT